MEAPVTIKVFNIRKEKGGFTIVSLGGGKQTKSLKIKRQAGKGMDVTYGR